jgi:hypothetical protein
MVGVELLPHVFVNIPDEKMHIKVFFIYIKHNLNDDLIKKLFSSFYFLFIFNGNF